MEDDRSSKTTSSTKSDPLDKATFKLDIPGHKDFGKLIPALDPRWADMDRRFAEYKRFDYELKVYYRSYVVYGEEISKSCEWLMKLPYHKFWSQIIYGHRSFRTMLDSYLSLCPRLYNREEMKATLFSRNSKIKSMAVQMHENIFYVILRMATPKEASRVHYMSPEFHSQLISEHKIFDVPRLIDFCSVYGPMNEKLARRILELVLKDRSTLLDQMKEFSSGVVKLLAKCESTIERVVGRKVKILRRESSHQEERVANNVREFLISMVYSLTQFAKMYPKALEYYYEAGFLDIIPHFIEQTVDDMLQDLYDRNLHGGFRVKLDDHIGIVGYARNDLVALWRRILEYNMLVKVENAKLDSKQDLEVASHAVDEVLSHLTNCLSEKNFLRLYSTKFPLSNDIEHWITRRIELDMDRVQYISGAMSDALDLEAGTKEMQDAIARAQEAELNIQEDDIRQMCEIFPDYNAAQAYTILKHYKGDADEAINSVLGGWLPQECPQLPREPVPPAIPAPAAAEAEASTVEKELVPLRESQKRGGKNVMEDKSHLATTKAFYEQYKNETEENEWERLEGVQPLNQPLVELAEDDEYDDTYDDVDVGLGNDMTGDETVAANRAAQKQGDQTQRQDSAEGRSYGNHGGRGGGGGHGHGRGGYGGGVGGSYGQGQQYGGGGGGGATASGGAGPSGQSRPYRGDYTGGKERQDKERNKGRNAHHDRKYLAMKKQSKAFGGPGGGSSGGV